MPASSTTPEDTFLSLLFLFPLVRRKHFREEGLSKNNSICENAVAQKYGTEMNAPGDRLLSLSSNFALDRNGTVRKNVSVNQISAIFPSLLQIL